MRRILLLVTDLEIGGTPTVVRELAVRLDQLSTRHGLEVSIHVACLSSWGPMADQIEAAGIPVTALGAESNLDLRIVPRLLRLLDVTRMDTLLSFLVHANAVAAACAAFRPGLRCFQSIQTSQPRPRWHWRVQGLVHPMAQHILVPSPSAAECAVAWSGIPRQKIVVIPNAVAPEEFAGLPAIAPDQHPFPIGFLGRLDPIKRLPDLLEAVRELRGLVQLHIFGWGPDEPAIRRLIESMRIEPHVVMHGPVPRPQEALERMGLLVLPSAAEGFGLVLIEAMAAGRPVVATDVPGIRDVVRNEETGLLVPVASPPDLASAIRRLVHDPSLRGRLAQAAVDHVRRHFTWDMTLEQYRRLLLG